jgi:YVTN family beta-propeller protein
MTQTAVIFPAVRRRRFAVIVLACLVTATHPAARGAEYCSPVALVADAAGKLVYVAEATADHIAEVDLASRAVRREFSLPESPSALVVSTDGTQLYAAGAVPEGRIHCLDLASGKITRSFAVGHTPTALALMPDGKGLYVADRFEDRVAVLDLKTGAVTACIAVEREPVALALTPDGSRLVVANHLPVGRADAERVSAAVSLIATASNRVVATLRLPNGSTGVRGVGLSPDGAFAYVTHILGRFHHPTTQLERGWMNTNALTIIDVRREKLLATVLLDNVQQGAANPWGVGCSPDGAWLAVAHAGSHEVSVIDRVGLHRALATPAPTPTEDNLSFMAPLQRRVALTGKGPRGLTVVGGRAVIANYFSDTLEVVNLPGATGDGAPIVLGPTPVLSEVRLGELAFNDASRCYQQWQSCASCHPDGRTDGLNWDLMNDGLGNPKNTRNMLNVHRRAPVMALGVRDCAEKAVRAGFRFIQFSVVPEEVNQAVDAYLKTLAPVPSPFLVDGKLSASAQRGRAVFESAGCAGCHSGPLFTNLKKYDFGFGLGLDKDKAFVTPTLVEVWRTAPYLHDGRAVTLRDVLITADPHGDHNEAKKLSAHELADLIDYVRSL